MVGSLCRARFGSYYHCTKILMSTSAVPLSPVTCIQTKGNSLRPKSSLLSAMQLLQIDKSRTTPYHPQSDGLVEQFNRTLTDILVTTVKEHLFEWERHLQKVCFAYNTSVHASTGQTLFPDVWAMSTVAFGLSFSKQM